MTMASKSEKQVLVESRKGNRMYASEREAQQLVRQYGHRIVDEKPAAKPAADKADKDGGAK